jgi:hypothetical protein
MSMGDLSSFWSLLWFLSSVVYSFHYRGVSLPLLSSFLGNIFCTYCKWNCLTKLFSVCSLLLYRNVINFYKFILYPVSFCLWCVGVDWVKFLGLLFIRSCLLQTGIILLLLFLFEFLLFPLPVLLLWLGMPRLCWVRVVRVDTLVSPDFI